MARLHSRPQTYSFRDGDGYAELESAGDGVVRFKAVGHYSATLSLQAIDVMAEVIDAVGHLHIFADFSEMSGYDSASRASATKWCRENLDALEAVHVLTRPGIVAMGVATAAMTLSILGLNMKAHSKHHTFEQALIEARGEHA